MYMYKIQKYMCIIYINTSNSPSTNPSIGQNHFFS